MFPGFPGEERRREIGGGNKPDDPSGAQFVATRPKELYRNSAERPRGITNPQRASAWVEWGVGVYMYVSVTFHIFTTTCSKVQIPWYRENVFVCSMCKNEVLLIEWLCGPATQAHEIKLKSPICCWYRHRHR